MADFISKGELDSGQIIIIHNRKKVMGIFPTMEGPKEHEVNPDPHPLTGIPVKVLAVQLPFVLVSFLGKIPNAPPTLTLDTRDCEFIEANEKFVNAYKELNWPNTPKALPAPVTEKRPVNTLGGLLELLGSGHSTDPDGKKTPVGKNPDVIVIPPATHVPKRRRGRPPKKS